MTESSTNYSKDINNFKYCNFNIINKEVLSHLNKSFKNLKIENEFFLKNVNKKINLNKIYQNCLSNSITSNVQNYEHLSTRNSNNKFSFSNRKLICAKHNTKIIKKRVNFNKFLNNNEEKNKNIKKCLKKKRFFLKKNAKILSNSTSTCSLTSLNSSTSSGFNTGESSNDRSGTPLSDFTYKEVENFKNLVIDREDTLLSFSVSSTPSSLGFGDYEKENFTILPKKNNKSNSINFEDTFSETCFDSTNNKVLLTFKDNVLNKKLFKTTSKKFNNTTNSDDNQKHEFLCNKVFQCFPIFLDNNNKNKNLQVTQCHTVDKLQNTKKITPPINNTKFEKIYNNQEQYYQTTYNQKILPYDSLMYESISNFNLSYYSDLKNKDLNFYAFKQSNNNLFRKNNYLLRKDYRKEKQNFKYKHQFFFFQQHQHLGFPITLPYSALHSWQALGLHYVNICNNQLFHFNQFNQVTWINPSTRLYLIPTNNLNQFKQNNKTNLSTECFNNQIFNQESNKNLLNDCAREMGDFCAQTCGSSGSKTLKNTESHYEISRMDVLSEQIMDFHQSVEQTQSTLSRKLNLRDMLYHTIAPIFPMCGLYIVGSSLNGFGNNKSDMDLCLMITNRDIDQRSDAVIVLQSIMRTLQTTKFVADQQLILAKVPILRIKFLSTFSDITVDLNANNSVAIRNTHLLCYYSSFDWRVRPLVSVVKEWAKRRGINDANRSSFTSYSLVLMVIHYLQCGADPPVLPSLQQLYSKRFNQRVDVRQLNVSLPLDPPPTSVWDFSDRLTLSELLIGFLQYYAFSFNFDTDAISIRIGRKTERAYVARNRSPYNHLSQWHCICIEEPFTFSNTAHSVYDERIFNSIKQTFIDGFHNLDANRDLHLFLNLPFQTTVFSNYQSAVQYVAPNSSIINASPVTVISLISKDASTRDVNETELSIKNKNLSDNVVLVQKKHFALLECDKLKNKNGVEGNASLDNSNEFFCSDDDENDIKNIDNHVCSDIDLDIKKKAV